MKKNIRILAAALLIFSLSACTSVEKPEVSESTSTQVMNTAASEIEQKDQVKKTDHAIASISFVKKSGDDMPQIEQIETDYELLSDEDVETLFL